MHQVAYNYHNFDEKGLLFNNNMRFYIIIFVTLHLIINNVRV